MIHGQILCDEGQATRDEATERFLVSVLAIASGSPYNSRSQRRITLCRTRRMQPYPRENCRLRLAWGHICNE